MANSYTQILYHVVFSTKNRLPAIASSRERDLYAYIYGVNQDMDCDIKRIGGIENHIHIAVSLNKNLSLSNYVEKIKTASTNWIRREEIFENWPGWQSGYGAFTMNWDERQSVIEYIKHQREHHKTVSFEDEYRALLTKAGIVFDEKYLF